MKKESDLKGIFSSIEEWTDDLPSLPDLDDWDDEDNRNDADGFEDDMLESNNWQVYTDSDYGFSMPIPDGWTATPGTLDADGGKNVNFYAQAVDVGVLVQYIPPLVKRRCLSAFAVI